MFQGLQQKLDNLDIPSTSEDMRLALPNVPVSQVMYSESGPSGGAAESDAHHINRA
jgi:hypothetical protein